MCRVGQTLAVVKFPAMHVPLQACTNQIGAELSSSKADDEGPLVPAAVARGCCFQMRRLNVLGSSSPNQLGSGVVDSSGPG
jgi:hypothetical protein